MKVWLIIQKVDLVLGYVVREAFDTESAAFSYMKSLTGNNILYDIIEIQVSSEKYSGDKE